MANERRWSVVAAMSLVLFVAFVVWRACVVLLRPELEIGPETTFITGPVRADGSLDYKAAIHERLSAGVSPEDNAAVLLLRAFGYGSIPLELRDQFFQRLGIEPPADDGQARQTEVEFITVAAKADFASDAAQELSKLFDRSRHRPWKSSDSPLVKEWLDANSQTLNLIAEASTKPNLYWPVVERNDETAALFAMPHLREAARLLVTRAMYRSGEGDRRGAQGDILACHRLAVLSSQRAASTNDFQVAIAVDRMASGAHAWIVAADITALEARECLAEFDKLAPLAPLANVIDQSTRLDTLDSCLAQFPQIGLDVNVMLRKTNRLCDEIVGELKHRDRFNRREGFAVIEQQLKQKAAAAARPMNQALAYVLLSRRAVSAGVSDALLAQWVISQRQTHDAELESLVQRDLVRISYCLAVYRAEHGRYPQYLQQLVPDFLPIVPTDPFRGDFLKYVPNPEGFRIYAVKANENAEWAYPRDVIAVEIPVTTED